MTVPYEWMATTVRLALWAVLSSAPALADGRISDDLMQSIHDRVRRGRIIGIAVGLIDADGREYFAAGRVADDGSRKPDENTVFEIGSITKAFVGVLLADMVARGEVALDDPIDKLLPKDAKSPMRDGKSIRLIDLATHRSGLPRLPTNIKPADLRNPYVDYSAEQLFAFLAEHSLGRDIGAKYEYSNLGVGLLGTLLARRGDSTLEKLIQSRITAKLEMTDTAMTLTPDMTRRWAKGHMGEAEVPAWDFQALAGAGALRSTAHDMLSFLAANMGLIETPLLPAMKKSHERRNDAGSSRMAIGLGWHIRGGGENAIIWHNGGTAGYRSFVGFIPKQKRGIVVLTNSSHDNPDDLGIHWLDPSSPLRKK